MPGTIRRREGGHRQDVSKSEGNLGDLSSSISTRNTSIVSKAVFSDDDSLVTTIDDILFAGFQHH